MSRHVSTVLCRRRVGRSDGNAWSVSRRGHALARAPRGGDEPRRPLRHRVVWTATLSPRLQHDDVACPPRAPRSAHCGLAVSGHGEASTPETPGPRKSTPGSRATLLAPKGFISFQGPRASTFTRATSRASARNARGSSRPVRRTFQASALREGVGAHPDRPCAPDRGGTQG